MSTQQQFELELLGWVSKLDEGHIATLRQLAAGPPQEFMRQLAATGLSRGALHIAAATIDQHGFEGAAGLVQGRLQEVCNARTRSSTQRRIPPGRTTRQSG
jgi:hypothetical protein